MELLCANFDHPMPVKSQVQHRYMSDIIALETFVEGESVIIEGMDYQSQ
jgi:hypothetical protein